MRGLVPGPAGQTGAAGGLGLSRPGGDGERREPRPPPAHPAQRCPEAPARFFPAGGRRTLHMRSHARGPRRRGELRQVSGAQEGDAGKREDPERGSESSCPLVFSSGRRKGRSRLFTACRTQAECLTNTFSLKPHKGCEPVLPGQKRVSDSENTKKTLRVQEGQGSYLAPRPGSNPRPQEWQHGVLTAGVSE